VASPLKASATSVAEIERELAALRDEASAEANLRTSVMTHLAWVPAEWEDAAQKTLAGLAERHPSRTIVLFPRPEDDDRFEAEAWLECFPFGDRSVCAEVIMVRLGGERASHPASVVLPLLIADLPVFCRWRGRPPFDGVFDELVGVVDRLIVDSTEWGDDLPPAYRELARRFDRTAVSDIAWARTERWRRMLAEAWPFEGGKIRVRGTLAQATLLAGWLRSRLGHDVELEHEPADILTAVAVDGEAIDAPPGEPPPPADLLSDELDRFTRDAIYEQAVRGAGEADSPE
jgi:Glucose-6-phosphate dehydrogenase subunit N-terminal domain/Glucose-6-phosphate dehydrogenase subunit C-terminal domain